MHTLPPKGIGSTDYFGTHHNPNYNPLYSLRNVQGLTNTPSQDLSSITRQISEISEKLKPYKFDEKEKIEKEFFNTLKGYRIQDKPTPTVDIMNQNRTDMYSQDVRYMHAVANGFDVNEYMNMKPWIKISKIPQSRMERATEFNQQLANEYNSESDSSETNIARSEEKKSVSQSETLPEATPLLSPAFNAEDYGLNTEPYGSTPIPSGGYNTFDAVLERVNAIPDSQSETLPEATSPNPNNTEEQAIVESVFENVLEDEDEKENAAYEEYQEILNKRLEIAREERDNAKKKKDDYERRQKEEKEEKEKKAKIKAEIDANNKKAKEAKERKKKEQEEKQVVDSTFLNLIAPNNKPKPRQGAMSKWSK